MTMDVSRLGIVVESTGINEARKAFDGGNGNGGLYGAAAKTEKAVEKLTATMQKLLQVNTSATTQAWAAAFGNMGGAVGNLNKMLQGTTATLQAMTQALQANANATLTVVNAHNQASGAAERHGRSGGVVTNTLKSMTTAALAYVSINTAVSIIKQADAWTMMQARLQNATHSMNNARVAQEQMFELAQRLGVPIEETVKLYTRLAPALQRAGKSSEYAKNMVEGIATALQLGGANGAETASVMLQLSQSFSSGVLNGAEFNAVAENGSVLMRALEKSLNKSTSELKKMGSQGQLTMEMVGKAIQENLPEWRKAFDNLPITFERAITRLHNAWTKALGEMSLDTGFSKQMSEALLTVEKLIPAIVSGLGNAFVSVAGWVEKNKDELGDLLNNSWLFVKSLWEVVKALGEINLGLGEAVGGVSLLSEAMKLVAYFAAAISDGIRTIAFFAGKLGLLIDGALVTPFQWALKGLEKLVSGFAELLRMGSQAAMATGKFELGAQLANMADGADTVANKMKATNEDIDKWFDKNHTMVNSWIADIASGNGAISSLTKSLEAASQEVQSIEQHKMDYGKGEMDENGWGANKNPKPPVDQKALKAAENELKKFQDAMATLNAQYEDAILLQKNLAANGLNYDKVTPAMKQALKYQEQINEAVDRGEDISQRAHVIHLMELRDRAYEVALEETKAERMKERLTSMKAIEDQNQTNIKSLRDEADQIDRQVASYGMAKGAIDALALADAKRRLADFQGLPEDLRPENYTKVVEQLKEIVAQRERIATGRGQLGQLDAAKEFDKLMDARKAEKFGDVLANGFGKAGKSLGALMNSFDKYAARQAKVAEAYKLAMKQTDPKIRAKEVEQASELEAESRIASYADMAGAAKGFFEEGSKGYKILEAAEKTFRAFQLAMQIKSFLQESGFITAITSLFVASKTTETAAEAASVGPHIAAEGAKQSSNAITALTSALAAPFPANIPAFAMVAAMLATIGVAVGGAGGGKSVDVAKMRQEQQGTGTVFGDEKAKSESISKAMDLVAKNSDIALRYSAGMLSSLQNIEYSLTGATSGVIRTGGGVTGKNFQNSSNPFGGIGGVGGAVLLGGQLGVLNAIATKLPVIGGLVSKLTSAVFGSSSTLQDSGLMGKNQSIANILQNGFSVQGYQDVQTKKKAFGITYSNKTSTNTSAVDPAISREFGNIVKGMVDSLASAAGALGESGDAVRAKLEAVNIDIGKISLKGLSSEEVQKQLEAVFSAIGDKLATIALPSVAKFQKAGEGLLETAVRVASGVEQANYALEKLGVTAVSFNDIVNTSGDVGAEIVRQSLLLNTTSTGIKEIISTLTGSATDLADTYSALTKVRDSLIAMHVANDVSRDLIRAAGGLDALQNSLSSYYDNYFSDTEKLQMKTSALRTEFAKLGLELPASKTAFRALVEQLSASGTAGQELAVKVLGLADAFSQLSDSQEQALSTAHSDLADAYDRESSALKDTRDKFEEFAKSLADFRTTLLTGDLSTLNVAEKYQVEKQKFEDTLMKAQTGDADAIGAFQDVATSFLNASREMNASGSVYTSDFQRVLDATDQLQGVASNKASAADQQLSLLTQQVSTLIEINTSVLTVAQAIQNLTALLNPAAPTSIGGGTGPTMGIPTTPTGVQIMDAGASAQKIAAEAINSAVVDQLQQLRAEQAAQTEATIAANHDSNMQNAQVIREGAQEMVSASYYQDRVQTQLA